MVAPEHHTTAYQSIPMSPSVDEKTSFIEEKDGVLRNEDDDDDEAIVRRQRSPAFVKLLSVLRVLFTACVAYLATLGLLHLVTSTPFRSPGRTSHPSYHSINGGHHEQHHHKGRPDGPGPFHGFPRPSPRPIGCFDISDAKAAVNFTVNLRHAGAPLHLTHTLSSAEVKLIADKSSDKGTSMLEAQDFPHLPPPPPGMPHHLPKPPSHLPHPPSPPGGPDHRPPPPPPHVPGPPGHRPPHLPHDSPQVILIEASRVAEGKEGRTIVTSDTFDVSEESKKDEKVFICSLELPFGQVGLGLFHEKPKKHDHKPDDADPIPPPPPMDGPDAEDEAEEPQRHRKHKKETFPDVTLEIHHPAGEPFSVTSGMPPFPRPHFGKHHRPSWKHKPGQDRKGGIVMIVTKLTKKVGCAGRRLMSKVQRSK